MDGSVGKINKDQKDFLKTAKKNLDRLRRLISDVLDYQQLASIEFELEMTEGCIDPIIEQVNSEMLPYAESKDLELKIALSPTLTIALFDHSRIKQIIRNLVENAIKFTDEGSVTISTKVTKEHIQVSIQDSGLGIKHEGQEEAQGWALPYQELS